MSVNKNLKMQEENLKIQNAVLARQLELDAELVRCGCGCVINVYCAVANLYS